ncbi:MAG: polyprenol monophosphomannose synthase [Planctomycetia bacterium]|nr:polyprenol monophosphomannose synthase [Planctomycetia bacterium]
MKNPQKILILLATFNEIENLPKLLGILSQKIVHIQTEFDVSFDILVIDDNSPDGTGRWCDENKSCFQNMTCIHRSEKSGLGSAVILGLEYAVTHEYDRVICMDADGSHPPRFLPGLLGISDLSSQGDGGENLRKSAGLKNLPFTADVVIGSRYIVGGKIVGWSKKRYFMSYCINFISRILLGLKVHDTSGSFRNYSVPVLRQLDFTCFESYGFSFFEEILWRLKRLNADMREVPICFEDRRAGISKLSFGECLRSLIILLKLGVKNYTGRN